MRQAWMSTEEWLTILICRLTRSEAIDEEIRRIVETETVDTRKLEQLCKGQRIHLQLASAICETALGSLYSREQVQQYDEMLRLNDLRYLKYEQELKRIQDHMREKGVQITVFKGISYYGTLFPSRRQRSLGDYDILVDRGDIVPAVHCMWELGYTAIDRTEGWTDEEFAAEAAKNLHVAQLRNERGYEVELHIATYYYTGLDLGKIVDRAVQQRAGIRVPRMEDVFLIACVHAWHHFPIRKNPLRTEFTMLGHLLDVYAGYQRLIQDYTNEQILELAAENDVEELVRFMVYTAYHVLDLEQNPMDISNNAKKMLDWIWGEQDISIERRYIRPEETADLMEEQFAKSVGVVEIPRAGKSVELPYRLEPAYGDPEGKWPCNILEAGDVEYPDIHMDFGISWTPEFLRFAFVPSENLVWRTENTNLDTYLSYMILRLGERYEEEPHYILLQCCNGELQGYNWPEGKSWKVMHRFQPQIGCRKEGKVYVAEIPWHLMGVNRADSGRRLYMDVQARLAYVREKKYVDVSWLAGNCGCMWNEVPNCSYLGNIQLL